MKLLVVGGGGREHAIIKKLKENPSVTQIIAAPGNGGIAADAVCVPVGAKDIDGLVALAQREQVDYAVVAPDDPLVLGAVDALTASGIPCFGPNRAAAIIEGSKVFSKHLMKKYGIPTAAYETFDDMDAALAYLDTAPVPVVVKADGLALGKGVIIAQSTRGGEGGCCLHDARRALRRERPPRCDRGVPDGAGGVGAVVHGRRDARADGLLHGPQARARRRRGS